MQEEIFRFRCYAKQEEGQWVAMCIDLCLAAQATKFEEARDKLHAQIEAYVHEALTEDLAHKDYLLSRKAPLASRVEYHIASVINAVVSMKTQAKVARVAKHSPECTWSLPVACCA